MEKVAQFKIPNSHLTYSIRMTYNENRILEQVEKLEIRRRDRTVAFNMLNQQERELFVDHYRQKLNTLPIVV